MARENMSVTSGASASVPAAARTARLVDERGTLTWRQLDERADALAAALQALPSGAPQVVSIMARNHRGFVLPLIAATASAPMCCC